jgi:hypothetical protein
MYHFGIGISDFGWSTAFGSFGYVSAVFHAWKTNISEAKYQPKPEIPNLQLFNNNLIHKQPGFTTCSRRSRRNLSVVADFQLQVTALGIFQRQI